MIELRNASKSLSLIHILGLDVPDSRGHQRKAYKGRGGKPCVLDEHDDGHRADGDEIRDQGGDAVGEHIL